MKLSKAKHVTLWGSDAFFIFGMLAASVAFGATTKPAGRVVIWQTVSGHPSMPFQPTGILQLNGEDVTNAIAVAAGAAHGLVLLENGLVIGFGNNRHGQAFAGEGQAMGWLPVPNSSALRFESSYVQQGTGTVRLDGQPLTGVASVAAALNHSMALRGDGTVVGWGTGSNGEPFRVPASISNIVALACGGDTDYFLQKDGHLLGLEENRVFTVPTLSNLVLIAANTKPRTEFVAVQEDGPVWIGSASSPARSLVRLVGKIKAVAGGGSHALALREDGAVIGFDGGTPNDLTNAVALAATTRRNMALREDGTVVIWGLQRQPTIVPERLKNVVAIAIGDIFAVAITTNAVAGKAVTY